MNIMRKVGLAAALAASVCFSAEEATLVDFTRAGHGWKGNPRTRDARQENGFSVELSGEDPWLEGPAVAVPDSGRARKLDLAVEAECGGSGDIQVFYAPDGEGFSAERSEWLRRSDDSSERYRGLVPVLSGKMRFRLDPPGSEGRVTVRALRALPLVPLAAPAFEKPAGVVLPVAAERVAAGTVEVAVDPSRWNAFACFVDGKKMAESNPDEALMYWDGKKAVAVAFTNTAPVMTATGQGFPCAHVSVRDAGGATWRLSRSFEGGAANGVRIETTLTVDQPREVVHLPWLTLFAGVGTFGERKGQALLPGVEYLEDEPSSNEKEIRGAAADRRMVDAYKVCYPMMALGAEGRWFSVSWEGATGASPVRGAAGDGTGRAPMVLPVSPLFDSPDRVFGSGGHVLGLWSPAVDGAARLEGEFDVYKGLRLEAGKTYTLSATLSGGAGDAATGAVADYVARRGLPPVPEFADGFDAAVRLLAAGWLDSESRQGLLWRHAVWGKSFPPARAEDVPAYLLWLAAHAPDAGLKARLGRTARAAVAELPKGAFGIHGISHVQRPAGALVYGDLEGLTRQAGKHARQWAERMSDGAVRYAPQEGKPDYGSTLGSDHCNGLTAISAEAMLVQASLSGDEAAIAAALAVLDKMTARYAGQVPRGAQPWEMPLHTPDIVASGRLVHCYVLGYLLSGRADYVEQARYWAWTGAAMVYLAQPVEGPVGRYATIGVIGATNWTAPNWIGQPVQWCGLVYRSALEELARVDGAQGEVWRTLARGMTLAGLQMCFPHGDKEGRDGLLPDYFLLRQQRSDGPAINPGTLQAHLAEAYGKTPMYTVLRLSNGSLLHVPGSAAQGGEEGGTLRAAVHAWPEDGYRVLLTRLGRAPRRVTWNGQEVAALYLEDARTAVVPLAGSGALEIVL
jgi:hypothetical protein